MNKEELIKKLNTICKSTWTFHGKEYPDIEANHFRADEALLEYINDEDISNAFNEIEKYYG